MIKLSEKFQYTPKEVLEQLTGKEGKEVHVYGFVWGPTFVGPHVELPMHERQIIEVAIKTHKS